MRKRVIVICGVLVICIIGVIVISLLKSNEAEFNPMDNVTMEIVEGTLTSTGATIVITDLSGEDNTYSEWYRVDKLEDGKWYELDDIVNGNVGWHAVGRSVGEDNKLTMEINWEWLYGPLKNGKYRIVKGFSNEKNPYVDRHVAAEFIIE